jgi:Xaa-Pro dipeptidase
MARTNGDKSFTRAPQKGCCSSDDQHAYTAGTPIGDYHSEGFEPQLLLIDAGGEWQNYAADITRTIPVGNGGKYTKEGGEIYELVLRMQKVRFTRQTVPSAC